ncbi:MAG: Crp/Fnr family transcriptional regulator [Deltaproteobacteria bacterium]|nr:Crp/Fnr family transcriptional regulator [Deltaproteobacteria bacterium]
MTAPGSGASVSPSPTEGGATSLSRKHARDFPAGTVLFQQGDDGELMYVVQSGRVEISRRAAGQDAVLAVLSAGEFFGEMSIINGSPRTATARVIEDARLLVIDGGTFEAMIRGSAEIAVRLIKKLAGRLEGSRRQIDLLLVRDPVSRVVQALRQEAENAGQEHPAGILVALSEPELAEHLGLSGEEVGTVLNRLERARLVTRTDGGGVVVSEIGKLVDFLDFLEMKGRLGGS